jgi:hypothetical protein
MVKPGDRVHRTIDWRRGWVHGGSGGGADVRAEACCQGVMAGVNGRGH